MARINGAHTEAERRAALKDLARYLGSRGYFRSPPVREPGSTTHRGYECRFVASAEAERDAIVRLLAIAGLRAGKPFEKGRQWRIPVYGYDSVVLLLDLLGELDGAKRRGR